jgi:hypothetical protein
MDWSKYREAFAWYDSENEQNFTSYKLPHHDISHDGQLVVVLRGVMTAGATVQGSRGGIDIPDADLDVVKAHLARHYAEFDRAAPWEQQSHADLVQVGKPQEKLEVEKKMPENIIEQVQESKGKGLAANEEVATMPGDSRRVIHESIVRRLRAGSLKEQWNAPIGLTPAPAARLRNYVILIPIQEGEAGDTKTVPYVKDFDMDILGSVGDSLTPKTGLTGTVTTTLKEAAATTDITYADIEKMTPEILSELEGKFEQAGYRAEDKEILDTLMADTGVPHVDHSGDATATFKAAYIAQAIGQLLAQGKEVNFGDCVLIINAAMYDMLLEDIAATQALAFARPDTIRDGLVKQLMGVNVVISNYLPTEASQYSAYLIHTNAVVLAPKRELLIETERNTRDRRVKLTGSHTFGSLILDNKAAVEILTKFS